MKKELHYSILLIITFLSFNNLFSQVKIGDRPSVINKESLFELESSDKVLVITRVTNSQMNNIKPLEGAMVYNIDEKCVFQYNGTSWNSLCGGSGTSSVGIKSTIDNGNGTFTIKFTDNSTFTSIDLTGPQGPAGPAGDTGLAGLNGTNGINGAKGDKGDKGDQGIQGEVGATGAKGDKGDKGDQGDQGIQGEKGEKGDQGIQGEKGEKGDQGIQGEVGATGAKGDKGDQGIQGIQGEVGATGAKGDQGIQGEVGAKGDKGDKGDQGIQGEKGDKGDKGDQGIQGEVGATGSKGDKGDQGIQGIQGEVGATGAKGDKGDKGDQGIQGVQGIQGEKGDKGDQGAAGTTPTITSYDNSVTVSKSGDNYNLSVSSATNSIKAHGKVRSNGNASSINGATVTRTGTGTYKVNLSNNMSGANYTIQLTSGENAQIISVTSQNANSFTVQIYQFSSGGWNIATVSAADGDFYFTVID